MYKYKKLGTGGNDNSNNDGILNQIAVITVFIVNLTVTIIFFPFKICVSSILNNY